MIAGRRKENCLSGSASAKKWQRWSHELVHIDGGVDNTLTCGQTELATHRRALDPEEAFSRESLHWQSYVGDYAFIQRGADNESKQRCRTHAWFVIKDFGWPLQ
jgi:hypothetical protein